MITAGTTLPSDGRSAEGDPSRSSREGLTGSLAVRLTLTTSVLIVAACVVLSMVLVRQHLADLRSDLVDRGQAISDFVAREAELGVLSGDVAALRKLGTVARTYPGVAYCRFFDRDGSLLASVGDDAPAPPTPVLTEPSSDAAPVAAGPDVSEFREAITTTLLRPHREELLDDEAGATEPPATRRRIGAVTIGLELGQLHAQRRLAFMTAVAFTLLVALLAAASAALLLHGTLRTVARAAELSQERSRLAELKASFVTQASHEFRTPLAVILACCTVLQDYGTRLAPEQRQRRLAKIRASVQHMTELLEDVLLLGRAESGKLARAPKPIDLEALCQEVVTDVQSTASDAHRLVLSCSGCEGETMVDPKLVRLVLRNLLANAVKYSPEGGTVRLDVARREGWVDLRVADQGIGIAKEDAPTLFEPFRRGVNVGAIPGSGLGLAITQKAVASLDGSITVESRPGRGTTFTVRVPVDSPTTSAHAAGPPVAEPLRASCCPEAGRSGR